MIDESSLQEPVLPMPAPFSGFEHGIERISRFMQSGDMHFPVSMQQFAIVAENLSPSVQRAVANGVAPGIVKQHLSDILDMRIQQSP